MADSPEKRINWTADEVIVVAAAVMRNGWRGFDERSPEAERLSGMLRAAPFHPVADRGAKFRNPNGVARKSYDVATRHPDYHGSLTNGGRIDLEVLNAFLADPEAMAIRAAAIEDAIRSGVAADLVIGVEDDDPDAGAAAAEGRLLLALHRKRERDPKLRAKKIGAVVKSGGVVACEVCGFDFGATYGDRGTGYIEVHHVTPLHHSGETVTRLADLALLCSNCHRMIHRRRPWITPGELQASMKSRPTH